jgi:hypothetical protein
MRMHEFKEGDKVRRISNGGFYTPVGHEDIVTHVDGSGDIKLKGLPDNSYWMKQFFELVVEEKPKPWLKITPPQEAKRELVSCILVGEYKLTVCDCSDRDGFDSVRIAEGPYGINKNQLHQLGETLIEISKEMK